MSEDRGTRLLREWRLDEPQARTCEHCGRNEMCTALVHDINETGWYCAWCLSQALRRVTPQIPLANNNDDEMKAAAIEVARRHRARPCTSPGDPKNCSICALAKVVYGEP